MSAVLCLPACLCVSAAASRGQAPHGNASPLGQELSLQYPWVKNSVFSTAASKTHSQVPMGQELSLQYP